ncbi:hypothetical protein J9A02_04585 [Pseudomonas sp. PNP]|nr:hypothetical protein [Pseudomonas sp. PNP]QUN70560.1 hypothetical protein KDB76_14825 [Pseudomonas sp. JS425]
MLRLLGLSCALAGAVCDVAFSAPMDLLDTPAALNQHAEKAVLLAISRAGQRLVAVGERGIVLLSDDMGRSWRQARAVPSSVALTAVDFVDAHDGWAVGHGGIILHSTDGGETWERQLDGNLAAQLEQQAAQEQVALGAEGAQRHLDNARQWVADGADKPFLDVHFTDARHGLAVGAYGLAMLTEDAGAHWRSVTGELDNRASLHLYKVLQDRQGVMIVGEQGTLLRASRLGDSFKQVPTPYHGTWFGALQSGSGSELVFGLKGNLYRSGDAGDWQAIATTESSSLTAGRELQDGSLVIASEAGRLLRSSDHGEHFQPLPARELDGSPITDLVQTADGALVVTGLRGVKRLDTLVMNKENEL